MAEIEQLLYDRLHQLGDAFEPSADLPRRIGDLIERAGASADPRPRSVRHIRHRRWATGFVMLGVVAAVILGAVFYGPRSAVPGGGPRPTLEQQPSQSTQQLHRALRAWSAFPVNTSPRPLILLEGSVDAPSSGFSDDASKIAFGDGAINAPAQFPSGPTAADGFPLIGAADAFGLFRSTAGPGPVATVDLTVASVRLGTAVFLTDRSYRSLPAWLFTFQGVQDPAAVLAVAPAAIFSAPSLPGGSSSALGAQLGSDGRTLTISIVGAPEGTGPCEVEYRLDTAVSTTGVALKVNAHQADQGRSAVCALNATVTHIVTVLASPLGNRVVIDASNDGAVPVAEGTTGG